jgi:F plasmid transfer operon protein TraF
MTRTGSCFVAAFVLLLDLTVAYPAAAQGGFEALGARAQGMGGAFVAVADDATATYWNPAGLALVPVFDAALVYGTVQQPEAELTGNGGSSPAWRAHNAGFSIALPVIGVSFFRLRTSTVTLSPIVPAGGVRQEINTAFVGGGATISNLGVTLAQSVGDAVVLGTTLRLVTGSAAFGNIAADSADAALDAADGLDAPGDTKFDLDVGMLVYIGRLRVGVTGHNLVAPTWDVAGTPLLSSNRLARIGFAVGPDPVRGRRVWTVAVDADLTTADAVDGERRGLAVGAERWFAKGRVAIRGGARAQTTGDARPLATGGASVGIWSGLLLEAQVTAGGDAVERGWGVGARVTF